MWRCLFPAILLATVGGCGAGTSTVSGTVRYQGHPVLSGCVTILSEDGTARSGVIQPDGTYVVEGVRRGRVRIGVASPDPARAKSVLSKADTHAKTKNGQPLPHHQHTKPGEGGWYPLPPNVGDPEKSGQSADISSSRFNHAIEIP
ncbi:hypothetical protein [Zavarzinella formosa]|uniref:hypothetical protein n=1 Tax=Zavarzinella formosa TaxID=360055 RepID=UPI0002E92716|nr:hypothetical protein [Zavarzinella formosa]